MFLIVSILTAFVITFITLPVVIKVSQSIDLLDIPDSRKVHSISKPSLGGIAIFSGFLLAILIAIPIPQFGDLKFFLCGLSIIFILGIRDDITSLTAIQKLFTQILAAFLVVYFADVRLTGFYGIFGIGQMPEWFNITFSLFVIVALTNSFNLIDGIDGLAASVAILILTFFGWSFLTTGQVAFAVVCLSVSGALIAFLFFNWHPSKVFMGDTGSMVLGFIISTLAIQFINVAPTLTFQGTPILSSSVGICVSLLILPIFDTIRVFAIRFKNGKSPLDPDQNHLHHGLLKLGMTHAQATFTLLGFNAAVLATALLLNGVLYNGEIILTVLGMSLVFGGVLEYRLHQVHFMGKSIEVRVSDELYLSKSA